VQISALQAQLAAHTKESLPAAEAERHRLEVAHLKVELDSVREELRQAKLAEAESRIQRAPEPAVAPEVVHASEPVVTSEQGAENQSV
jgi:hypothetical protein